MNGGFRREPALSFFICGVQRSGTTFLAGLLSGTGVAGRPDEDFAIDREPAWARLAYAAHVVECVDRASTPNGVFGTKLLWGYHDHLLCRLRRLGGDDVATDRAVLERTFPDPRFIWIRREDVVAQAVSWAKAHQTGEWLRTDLSQTRKSPAFDFEQIHRFVAAAESRNDDWRRWFAEQRLEPLSISYEGVAADSAGLTRRALAFLGIDYPDDRPIAPLTQRQADGVNADWIARYHAVLAARRRRARRRRAWDPPRGVTASYVVCHTARSGALLLAETLDRTRLVGRPQRCGFRVNGVTGARDFGRFLTRRIERHSRGGVFGAKIASADLEELLLNLRTIPGRESLHGRELLESVFPSLRFIWIHRVDVLAQAVSWSRAQQSGIWAARDRGNGVAPSFDHAELGRLVDLIEQANAGWQRWFADWGIAPLPLRYEELDAEPRRTARDVLAFLGLEVPADLRFSEPPREHADVDAAWVEHYRELERTAAANGARER